MRAAGFVGVIVSLLWALGSPGTAVEPQHGAPAGALRTDDLRRLPVDEEVGSGGEPFRVVARVLHDE